MAKSASLEVTSDHDTLLLEGLAANDENQPLVVLDGQVSRGHGAIQHRTLQPDITPGSVAGAAIRTKKARQKRGVIAVVDNASCVRHEISEVLSGSGYDVRVFHSPEALVASNALHAAGMLIVGGLRYGLAGCEPLAWAAVEHAELPMLLISKSRIEVCRLGTLYSGGCVGSGQESSPSDRLESLFVFLRRGSDMLSLYSTLLVSRAA
jgi:hypothetical protein